MSEKVLVTITERTPTEDSTDLTSRHFVSDSIFRSLYKIDEWAVSFGIPVSITIVPWKE